MKIKKLGVLIAVTLLAIGVGVFFMVPPLTAPATSPPSYTALYPSLYATVDVDVAPMPEKTIYLTFDDGPSKNTERLLDILKKYDVKATFFIIGREEEQYKNLIKRMAEEGHTVAPHTYSHVYKNIYRSVEDYLTDFNQIYEYIADITGEQPSIFRFPGGSTNRETPSKQVLYDIVDEMTRRGFVYYDWNVVSGDDTATVYPKETLLRNIKKGAKGKDSVVVLCHDAPLCKTTPDAVELVIEQFQAEGYTFAALSGEVDPIQFDKKYRKR